MTTQNPLDDIRRDQAALEAELIAGGSIRKGKNWQCGNPDHPDIHPSAWNYSDDVAVWRHRCGACGFHGDVFDLRAAIQRRPLADVLREARASLADSASKKPKASPSTVNYDPQANTTKTPPSTPDSEPPAPDMFTLAKTYHAAIRPDNLQTLADDLDVSVESLKRLRVGWCDRDGAYSFPMRDAASTVTGIRLRSGNAKFAERGGHDGLFIPNDLKGGGVLVACEGPTDLAAILDVGFDAIGRPNNTGRGAEDYIAQFAADHKYDEIWIVTDSDPEGSGARAATDAAADRLALRLVPLTTTVKVFAPPAPHKDVRAWRQAGATGDDIEALADATPSRGPAGELREILEAEIDGTRCAIEWPWQLVTSGTQALIPGTITLVAGDPGSGKSLWILEALARWHGAGVKVTVFELEQTRAYHLKRALAQRVGASWLTDIKQVASRPDDVRAHYSEHAAWQDSFGRTMNDAPTEPVSLDQLIGWVEVKAKAGARIIVIDPITSADTTDKPWDDARRFIHKTTPILDRYGASLILVTHPRKGSGRSTIVTMDDLAGGAAWARFSQTVLWLERHDEPKPVTIRRLGDPLAESADVTRTLRIMKARNGRGAGWQLAMEMDPATLRFDELGAIVKPNSVNSHTEAI